MEHRDVFLLEEIIRYCDQIATTASKHNFDTFCADLDARDACALRAMQIGELAGDLSEQFTSNHPDIPWHEIIGLRNVIAHEYGDIDNGVLWEIITEDMPPLRDFCIKTIGVN